MRTTVAHGMPLKGVIAVISAGGGVGCSVLAAALADRGCRSGGVAAGSAVLVDADRFGGGLDVLLSMERVPGIRWPEASAADPDVPARDLLAALPRSHSGFALLSMARDGVRVSAEDAGRVLAALSKECLVVVDISRDWESPIASAAVALAEQLVLVMTTSMRSVAAALAACALFIPDEAAGAMLEEELEPGWLPDEAEFLTSAPRLRRQMRADSPGAQGFRAVRMSAVVREVRDGASFSAVSRAFSRDIPAITRMPHDSRLARGVANAAAGSFTTRSLDAVAARLLSTQGSIDDGGRQPLWARRPER